MGNLNAEDPGDFFRIIVHQFIAEGFLFILQYPLQSGLTCRRIFIRSGEALRCQAFGQAGPWVLFYIRKEKFIKL